LICQDALQWTIGFQCNYVQLATSISISYMPTTIFFSSSNVHTHLCVVTIIYIIGPLKFGFMLFCSLLPFPSLFVHVLGASKVWLGSYIDGKIYFQVSNLKVTYPLLFLNNFFLICTSHWQLYIWCSQIVIKEFCSTN
jgi:hypothetical protein